jgi:hypothetical protein
MAVSRVKRALAVWRDRASLGDEYQIDLNSTDRFQVFN